MTIMGKSATAAMAPGPTGSHRAGEIVETIVQQNLGVYRASPSRLQEDVSQEAQVVSDYRGRLVYELLQNADDAMESSASDAAPFPSASRRTQPHLGRAIGRRANRSAWDVARGGTLVAWAYWRSAARPIVQPMAIRRCAQALLSDSASHYLLDTDFPVTRPVKTRPHGAAPTNQASNSAIFGPERSLASAAIRHLMPCLAPKWPSPTPTLPPARGGTVTGGGYLVDDVFVCHNRPPAVFGALMWSLHLFG